MPNLLTQRRILRPFRPDQIPGLSLWLDAADAATITLDSGAVSRWDDKSGNGRNLTQSNPSNRPGWSIGDGIEFTAASHQLTNSTSVNIVTNMTAFVAFRCTNVAAYATTAGNDVFANHGGWAMQTVSSGFWGRFATTKSGVGTRAFTAISQIKTTDRIFRVAASATDIRARVTGATIQEATAAATTGGSGGTTTVGAFPRGNMVVREVIFYPFAMTDPQIAEIERYLSQKWGTT